MLILVMVRTINKTTTMISIDSKDSRSESVLEIYLDR